MNERLQGAGYRVDYLVADSKCSSAESIRGMTDHYLNGTLAFIGPENTCAFEARVAAAWNLPMIGFVSIAGVGTDTVRLTIQILLPNFYRSML